MRYTQTKEDSVRLLREAIARMRDHDAPPDPRTFAVWYEHLAGINAALSSALSSTAARTTLSASHIDALYKAHIEDDASRDAEMLGGTVQRVLTQIEEAALRAGEKALSFERTLDELAKTAADAKTSSELTELFKAAAAETRDMQQAVRSLQDAVVTSEAEINVLRQDLERARAEAQTDALTGLLNRKGFDQALNRLVGIRPEGELTHALVLLDIDRFKLVNDTHGHLTGDAVLVALADVIGSTNRSGTAACARYGGEEFAILFESTTLAKARGVAAAVCSLVKDVKVPDRTTGQIVTGITLSGGIATWRTTDSGESVIAAADKALYHSKNTGRNKVTIARVL